MYLTYKNVLFVHTNQSVIDVQIKTVWYVVYISPFYFLNHYCLVQWIVPQFLNLRPKMAKSIVYVITLITNRNHAFHCLN